MAQRTVRRRIHTGGLLTEVTEHATPDGTTYLIVIGWNPAMPSAPFDRMGLTLAINPRQRRVEHTR